jgi:hypothetical protein
MTGFIVYSRASAVPVTRQKCAHLLPLSLTLTLTLTHTPPHRSHSHSQLMSLPLSLTLTPAPHPTYSHYRFLPRPLPFTPGEDERTLLVEGDLWSIQIVDRIAPTADLRVALDTTLYPEVSCQL